MLEVIYTVGAVVTLLVLLGKFLRRYVAQADRRVSQLVFGLVGVVILSGLWPLTVIAGLSEWYHRHYYGQGEE